MYIFGGGHFGARCRFTSAATTAMFSSSVLSYCNLGGDFFVVEDLFGTVLLAAGAAVLFLFFQVC
jgi:hypothetical protein